MQFDRSINILDVLLNSWMFANALEIFDSLRVGSRPLSRWKWS